jgi:hypothetical protein
MKIFYSKSTGGFYADEIHGDRLIEFVTTDPETGATLNRWNDANPDCLIPIDAVEITENEHAVLLAGQSAGQRITADVNGRPELTAPHAPTADEQKAQANVAIQAQIDVLEKNQARAVREAALGIDGAVDRLKALDQKIRALAGGFIK